jgi:hypothetical protein
MASSPSGRHFCSPTRPRSRSLAVTVLIGFRVFPFLALISRSSRSVFTSRPQPHRCRLKS